MLADLQHHRVRHQQAYCVRRVEAPTRHGGMAFGVRLGAAPHLRDNVARRTKLILLALAMGAALGLACAPAVRQWFAVDACLDAGGCWDGVSRRCEYTTQANCSR